jgi:cell division protein FtsZ
MSIQLTVPPKRELKPRIVVFGVGGAGGNAVNNMVAAELDGVDFVVANTDAQALSASGAERRIQMGGKLTEGLGAGSDPEVGRQAAEETLSEITDMLQGSHMAFVTAGMGGGTGTGAAPVIARAARELGILTVGVVTKPFDFEGARRMRSAMAGINELAKEVDTLIIIPNQNLFRIANAQTTFAEAFAMADEVLHSGVSGITDLMMKPGLINLDFADVRTVMNEMGKAMMGTGEGTGENRAIEAAEAAIANPLLDDVSMRGANGVLINISGGNDMTLYELDEAANRIKDEVDSEANIIIGSTFDDTLEGTIRVSVVATGIEAEASLRPVEDTGAGRVVTMPTRSLSETAEPIVPEQPVIDAQPEAAPSLADTMDAPEAAPIEPVAASDETALPGFLTERPMAPPAREIPKQSRSFIERVFGSKKKQDDTPKSALVDADVAAEAPRADIVAPEVLDAAQQQLDEAPAIEKAIDKPAAVASDVSAPAAFMEELDGPAPDAIPAVAAPVAQPKEVATVQAQPVMKAEREVQVEAKIDAEVKAEAPTEVKAEVTAEPKAEKAPEAKVEAAQPEVKPEVKAEVKPEVKAEAPKAAAPKPAAPKIEAPVISQTQAVASTPVAQPSMQTNTQTTMSASYDSDQLDIPAFLRR